MASKTPPRFVPTLTEVVHSGPVPLSPAAGVSQEQIVQRVLQRVELVLDRRVRETIATAILEQTSQLTPVLHERLDALVRQLVAEALAEEMGTRGTPPSRA